MLIGLVACVRVDVCRFAITPSVDGLLQDHGYRFAAPDLSTVDLPPASALFENSVTVPETNETLSITQLRIPNNSVGLVYCGGNGFRKSARSTRIAAAFSPPPDLFLFDYPGYGNSGGESTIAQFDHATNALATVIEQWQIENQYRTLYLWGKSFGGTVCARLASLLGVDHQLIIETSYNDLYSLVNSKAGLFKNILQLRIDPAAPDFHIDRSLVDYPHPVTLIGVKDDPVTPYNQTLLLQEKLEALGVASRMVSLRGIGHQSLFLYPCLLADALTKAQLESLRVAPEQCSVPG